MFSIVAWSTRLLWCEPSLSVQLLETALLGAMFCMVMPASARHLAQKFKARPWYDRAAALMRDSMGKMMKMDVTDAILDKMMGQMVPLLTQHFVGGMLCAPAIFGLGVPHAAAMAMARHGALVELGWELQDTAERVYERFFTADGAKTQPGGLFFFFIVHHAMQWTLVIPMNLYYSELSGYHELVFMLEGAAGFAGAAGFYGLTLDISKRSELRRMVILNAFGLCVMVYTRLVHYWWSVYKCLRHFYFEESYVVLAAGVICSCLLMPYIAVMVVPEQWSKLKKFTNLYMANGDRGFEKEDFPALLKGMRQCEVATKAPHKKHL